MLSGLDPLSKDYKMVEIIAQVCIFTLGVLSIILIAQKNKWGFVCGLATQPFWYYTTYVHGQWGIFFLNIAYTVSWTYGIFKWFRSETPTQTHDADTGLPWQT